MADELLNMESKPAAKQLIAGWRRQWSDGGEISGGLPRYLISKLGATQIGEMGPEVSKLCYPFQVPGTHDTYRPRVAYNEGLPVQPMTRRNRFYDAGNGLIIFLGQEPWFRIDVYAEAFFKAAAELGSPKIVAVEGYNGAAPPEMERSVSCIYSRADMKENLDQYGLRYSNYGSQSRNGPTIAMAPMYPFLTSSNDPVGISRDHRAFYDIMRRLKSMFDLDIDLSELLSLGEAESQELVDTLEKIATTNPTAKELIDRAKADFNLVPFETSVSLDPALDRTLEDILRNAPDQPDES